MEFKKELTYVDIIQWHEKEGGRDFVFQPKKKMSFWLVCYSIRTYPFVNSHWCSDLLWGDWDPLILKKFLKGQNRSKNSRIANSSSPIKNACLSSKVINFYSPKHKSNVSNVLFDFFPECWILPYFILWSPGLTSFTQEKNLWKYICCATSGYSLH